MVKISDLPDRFFELKDANTKLRGSPLMIKIIFAIQIIGVAISFAVLFAYFNATNVTVSLVSLEVLDSSYRCVPLSPKNGITYYSGKTSENAQFRFSTNNYDECLQQLKTADPCETVADSALIQIVAPKQYLGGGCKGILANGALVCSYKEVAQLTGSSFGRLAYGESSAITRPTPPLTNGTGKHVHLLHFALF